jgi:hypothetical protein
VYGEEVSDLLAPGSSGLQIRDGDQHQGIYVEGLSEHAVVNGGWAQHDRGPTLAVRCRNGGADRRLAQLRWGSSFYRLAACILHHP